MDATIDDLIDEIFKKDDKVISYQQASSWDSSRSSDEDIFTRRATAKPKIFDEELLVPTGPFTTLSPLSTSVKLPIKAKDFDNSSEEGDGAYGSEEGSDRLTALAKATSLTKGLCQQLGNSCQPTPAAPFPSLPSAGLPACPGQCYVTNVPAAALLSRADKSPFPAVEGLKKLCRGVYDRGASLASILRRKGAFYVGQPDLGNGCLDGKTSGAQGGCPHILCLKCNYVVIRLQGAEWVNADGGFDLYLTTRNYYPDWALLAGSSPFGAEGERAQGSVLRENPHAAAYCCQCSFLTVKAARVAIMTKLTDVAIAREDNSPFAIELPLLPSQKQRRPPLWVCKGHSLV